MVTMKAGKLFITIFKQNKKVLIGTYLLFSIETAGLLLRPLFLGIAVDDLVKGSYSGLLWLSAIHISWLIVGVIRQRYDTRTYTRIYQTLVMQICRNKQKGNTSQLNAHIGLAKELTDFLEFDLVYILEAFYNIAGAIILLMYYNTQVVLICIVALLPVTALSFFYGKKMKQLNSMKHDELEKQVRVINTGDEKNIVKHFNHMRFWQIRISDQQAWNFGWMELIVLLIIGGALWASYTLSETIVAPGAMVAIYSYVLKFTSGLDTLPYAIERAAVLSDIATRIEIGGNEKTNCQKQNNESQLEFYLNNEAA